jgi:hypothetical protein
MVGCGEKAKYYERGTAYFNDEKYQKSLIDCKK